MHLFVNKTLLTVSNLYISNTKCSLCAGFLPVFGPTFVNMYGSTREFSDLPDEFEELNLGIVSIVELINRLF